MSIFLLPSEAMFSLGLDWSIKLSFLLAIVSVTCWIMRRNSAAIRHRTWSIAILGGFVIPAASWLLPTLAVPVLPCQIQVQQDSMDSKSLEIGFSPYAKSSNNSIPNEQGIDNAASSDKVSTVETREARVITQPLLEATVVAGPSPRSRSFSLSWPLATLVIWLFGLICFMSRLALGWWYCNALSMRGMPISIELEKVVNAARLAIGMDRRVETRLSIETRVPLAIGVMRNRILMPVEAEQWTATRQRCAVLHEMVHHERCDVAWQMIAQVACSIYWFHPLVWYAAHRLRIERELACDDRAVQIDNQAADYAQQLVDIARHASNAQFVGAIAMAQTSGLEQRIEAIFDRAKSHVPLSRIGAIRLAIVLTVCMVSIAVLKPAARALQNELNYTAESFGDSSGISIEFRGKFEFPVGTPAQPVAIDVYQGKLRTDKAELICSVRSVDGGFRFESARFGNMLLHARTTDSAFQATVLVQRHQLLSMSLGGIRASMEKAKTIECKVVDNDIPVADAIVHLRTIDQLMFQARTDHVGVVKIQIPNAGLIGSIRAHTHDGRLASLNLVSERTSKKLELEHRLELFQCQKHKIRATDENGSPVPNLRVVLMCSDAKDSWILEDGLFESTTDQQGEAVFEYQPKLPNGRSLIRLSSNLFFVRDSKVKDEGMTEVSIRPYTALQKAECHIELPDGCPEGLLVRGSSFQSAKEHMNTEFFSRVDKNGRFEVQVVPGYTYVVHIEDANWVSPAWHGVIIDPEAGVLNSPSLYVSKGIPVEISVTTGERRRPMAKQRFMVLNPHRFKWKDLVSGEIRNGMGGYSREAITDSSGRVIVMAPPGELVAHVLNGSQLTEVKLDVSPGQPAKMDLHLAVDDQIELRGRVKIPAESSALLQPIKIRIKQVDSIFSHPNVETICDAAGRFKANIESSKVMIYAESEDRQYAGAIHCRSDQSDIELPLAKTGGVDGVILDDEGFPLVDCKVTASVSIRNNALQKQAEFQPGATVSVEQWSVETNSRGEFSLRGIPANVIVAVYFKERDTFQTVAECMLSPGEVRTFEPVRFGRNPSTEFKPLAERFASLCQINRLLHSRAMVIVSGAGESAKKFVDDHALDFEEHPDVYSFIPMSLSSVTLDEEPASRYIFEKKGWILDAAELVLIVAYDVVGQELGRIKLDTSSKAKEAESVKAYEQFLTKHKPPIEDAESKVDQALAEAKATNRRLWVVNSGTRCGPCRVLARWMDAQHTILEKAIVPVHFDSNLDLNAEKVLKRLNEPLGGIPWHAILDADGNVLINSEVEILGNIGWPGKWPETMSHFQKMIEVAGQGRLSRTEIETLVESVKKN
jgi:beta-lactamase regulating signal transducer with metallopeptidase domain